MTRTLLRLTASLGLTFLLSLAFTPFGCGGNQAWTVAPIRDAPDRPTVPPATFDAMTACVTAAKERLTDTVYAQQIDAEVGERGEIRRVTLRDSYPVEPGLEACIKEALVGATVPPEILDRLVEKRAVSPASRGLQGQVWEGLAAGAAVELGPIVLLAAAVTVTVIVGVKATTEVIDAIRRKRKRREQCLDMFETCVQYRPWSCRRKVDVNRILCEFCRSRCEENQTYEPHNDCYPCGFRDPN
jgi:hypothetical protein